VLCVSLGRSPDEEGCDAGTRERQYPKEEKTSGVTGIPTDIKVLIKNTSQIDGVKEGEENHRANRGTEERNPDHRENRLFVTAPLFCAPVFFADHYFRDKLAI
jgi:hypothetical protein